MGTLRHREGLQVVRITQLRTLVPGSEPRQPEHIDSKTPGSSPPPPTPMGWAVFTAVRRTCSHGVHPTSASRAPHLEFDGRETLTAPEIEQI